MEDRALGFLFYQRAEHDAWMDVMAEMTAAGVGDVNAGGKDERLAASIMRWGEELAQLRLNDPTPHHGDNALKERREQYDKWQD